VDAVVVPDLAGGSLLFDESDLLSLLVVVSLLLAESLLLVDSLVLADSLFESLASPVEDVSAPLAASALAPPSVFPDFAPPLKSVTYQPLPFNWKPAAETFFTRASAPQDGHVTSGASENFRRASSSCPQDEQRYS